MVGVIWYRFVRYSGTDWSATLVPIRPLLWYRLERCAGTDSSATVVPIRRYYQHKNVQVHRFITQNTFEERIDAMIQEKKHLADLTVSTGESWIGKLSNKELHEIFG